MSEKFLHGVEVIEINEGPRTVTTANSSVIGIVGTAPEADPDVFPLNTPVLIAGSLTKAAKLGKEGSLPDALDAIFNQIGAMVVIVRVEDGENINVIGEALEDGTYTGAHAFLSAKSELGVTPRVLILPQFSSSENITALIPIAERLRAIIVADASNDEKEAVEFSKKFSSSRVYVVYPNVINTNNKTVPLSSYVAGVIAKTDNTEGFWVSVSNHAINGIIGLSKPVDFSLGDSNSKANYLNENNITTVINENGLRVWGNRTCSDDEKWRFLSVRRTADIINDSILKAHLWAVDRNITKNYLESVTESVNAYLANLRSQGAILSGKCYANSELNTAQNISQGKVYFDFEFTPAYPAEQVTFRSYINNGEIETTGIL